MKLHKSIILVVTLVVLVAPVEAARADVAPPPAPGLGGLRPFEYQPTEVQMLYERVELTLQPLPPSSDDGTSVEEQVDVTAWFVLHNTGAKDEEMKVAFPLDDLNFCDEDYKAPRSFGIAQYFITPDSFKVTSDGTALQTQSMKIVGIDCVGWETFDVKFPVNKDVLIKVDYSMTTWGSGSDLILEYILETGAGWKGPIKQAYIVFRFPYLATSENVDAVRTTPGYQSLYNEIFWSYRDLEPTPDDNINVAFFEPRAWMDILTLNDRVAQMSTDTDAWLRLLDEYTASYNSDRVIASFENAIKSNPDNAELYAKYAAFIQSRCCLSLGRGFDILPPRARENADCRVIPLLNHALALDPQNRTALDVLYTLHWTFPALTYTPPPTIPPTATPAISNTPTITPLPSSTPSPSQTPVVETVVITKIITVTPVKAIPTPTPTPGTLFTNIDASGPCLLVGLLLLVAGFAGGVFASKKKRGLIQ